MRHRWPRLDAPWELESWTPSWALPAMNGLMNAPNFKYVPLETGFSNRLFVQGGLRSHFLCSLTSQRPDAGFPAETSLRKHRAIILWRGFLVAAVAAPHFPRFFWSQGFTFHWGHRQTMIIHDISRLSKDWVHPRRKPPCTIILLLGRKPCFATWNLRSASKVTLKCPLIQLRHTMLSSWEMSICHWWFILGTVYCTYFRFMVATKWYWCGANSGIPSGSGRFSERQYHKLQDSYKAEQKRQEPMARFVMATSNSSTPVLLGLLYM